MVLKDYFILYSSPELEPYHQMHFVYPLPETANINSPLKSINWNYLIITLSREKSRYVDIISFLIYIYIYIYIYLQEKPKFGHIMITIFFYPAKNIDMNK